MRANEFTNFSYKTEPYEGWNGDGIVVRAYDGNTKVGHVIFEPTEDDNTQWYAVEVEVEEPYQRKGIATKMYDIAKKAATQQGAIIVRSHAQTDAGRGLWQDKQVWEQQDITEAKVSIRDQILSDVKKNGPGQYFVRFTGIDKLGYSAKQWFGKTPDADDPNFDVDYIGHGKGRPVLWFYPLETYLDQNRTVYASEQPYAWLVKLKPNAWLQPIKRGEKGIKPAPEGKERVGILRMSQPPAALFFTHGYDVIGKYYDYGGQHKRHGEVKGKPVYKPTFFDKVRGDF